MAMAGVVPVAIVLCEHGSFQTMNHPEHESVRVSRGPESELYNPNPALSPTPRTECIHHNHSTKHREGGAIKPRAGRKIRPTTACSPLARSASRSAACSAAPPRRRPAPPPPSACGSTKPDRTSKDKRQGRVAENRSAALLISMPGSAAVDGRDMGSRP